jgi:hypothetical protein
VAQSTPRALTTVFALTAVLMYVHGSLHFPKNPTDSLLVSRKSDVIAGTNLVF